MITIKENEKQNKEQYLVETKEAVSYILDRDYLETVLVCLWAPADVIALGYGKKLGWHIGTDNRIYENYELNEKGVKYHKQNFIHKNSIDPILAMKEMEKETNTENLKGVKHRLQEFFDVNEIYSISPYTGKELLPAEKHETKTISIKLEKGKREF